MYVLGHDRCTILDIVVIRLYLDNVYNLRTPNIIRKEEIKRFSEQQKLKHQAQWCFISIESIAFCLKQVFACANELNCVNCMCC